VAQQVQRYNRQTLASLFILNPPLGADISDNRLSAALHVHALDTDGLEQAAPCTHHFDLMLAEKKFP
jgi:hypothetical protein